MQKEQNRYDSAPFGQPTLAALFYYEKYVNRWPIEAKTIGVHFSVRIVYCINYAILIQQLEGIGTGNLKNNRAPLRSASSMIRGSLVVCCSRIKDIYWELTRNLPAVSLISPFSSASLRRK